jgi:uncharacterized protein YajQ (UPF0234 family)
LQDKDLMLSAEDETKLRNMNDILQGKLVKRGISLKALDYQKIGARSGRNVRQLVKSSRESDREGKGSRSLYQRQQSKGPGPRSRRRTVRVSGKDRDTAAGCNGQAEGK